MRYSTFNHLDLKIFDMKPLIEIINTDNEPNIIDQILTNKPMQQQINYCDIMALDFTAEDGNDEVFEKMHGYPYTIFTKMLAPTLMLDWNQTTRLCELLVIDPEDGHIFERIPIVDLMHLQRIIDAFGRQVTPLQNE